MIDSQPSSQPVCPTNSQASVQPDPELLLTQTLHQLATHPIPEGLEARLLAHLTIASSPLRTPLRSVWSTVRRALLPTALTFATAAILVIVAHHPHPAAPATHPTLALQSPPAIPTTHPTPSSPTPIPRAPHRAASSPPTQPNDPDTALALAESNAPSQLAPDLPLTADERALQHLAQHPNPEALNALIPTRVAAEQLAENAAFEAFFTKPSISAIHP